MGGEIGKEEPRKDPGPQAAGATPTAFIQEQPPAEPATVPPTEVVIDVGATETPEPTIEPVDTPEVVAVGSVAPAAPLEALSGHATHYGVSYQGGKLGCGPLAVEGAGPGVLTGVYLTDDPTIAAVSPARYNEWPCGTPLEVCGPGGCARVIRADACPGCYANLVDLSEAANVLVCGAPPHTCTATIRRIYRVSYRLETKIPWAQTAKDLSVSFGKWRVKEHEILSSLRGAASTTWRQTADEAEVVVRFLHPTSGAWIPVTSKGQARAVDNLRVCYLAIEAMRLNELRGIDNVIREAYLALPAPVIERDPWEVLQCRPDSDPEVIDAVYRSLARKYHPDAQGGDNSKMVELNAAYEKARGQEVPA